MRGRAEKKTSDNITSKLILNIEYMKYEMISRLR